MLVTVFFKMSQNIRFPVVRPTAENEALRQTRLLAERKQAKAKEELKKKQHKQDIGKLDEEAYVRGEERLMKKDPSKVK